ncbi:MAG: hypothetical protein M1814_005980 [Vezdaea aestivalis]|nr:MAG: hypothetical protein M1814_005980 [Vezdaea aestivalis]
MFGRLLPLLCVLAVAAADKAGYTGTLSTLSGGLRGTVTILDDSTFLVKNYQLGEAGAPALYWWGAKGNDLEGGFRINTKQVRDSTRRPTEIRVKLDAGKTPDDFDVIGMWCERYDINFGETVLKPGEPIPSASGAASSVPPGASQTQGASSPTTSTAGSSTAGATTMPAEGYEDESGALKPIISNFHTTARAYFFCVLGMVVLQGLWHLATSVQLLLKPNRSYPAVSSHHSRIYLSLHRFFTLPSPIPSITNHRLPQALQLAVFVGLNILWGWNRNEYDTDYDLYGWLTLANGGLALLFGARNNLFATVLRVPSTTLLQYHRWTGRATVVHVTIHFSALVSSYVRSKQIGTVLQTLRIQVGLMAFIALWIMALTSVSIIRRHGFELFYYLHALFILFVIGALIHATHAAEFIVPGLALWVIDRMIRFSHNFRKIEVVSTSQYPGDLTKFTVRGVPRHNPGQIAWIQIPGVSFLNWHPFTVVSSPTEGESTFAIRGLGGYTKKVQSLALQTPPTHFSKELPNPASKTTLPPQPKLRVDGPYGVGRTLWGGHPITVLVAGGVGLTPGLSIAFHILALSRQRVRSAPTSLPPHRSHIHILWTVKSLSHTSWFASELASLTALASHRDSGCTLDLHIHVTGNKAEGLDAEESASGQMAHSPVSLEGGFEAGRYVSRGRPDLKFYFGSLRRTYPGLDAVVSACGPRSMVAAVRRAAVEAQRGREVGIYHVDEEIFEL